MLLAVCFYLNADLDDYEAVSGPDRCDFVVREYHLDAKLVPIDRPGGLERHSFHRVVQEKVKGYPSLSKYYKLFAKEVYGALREEKANPFDNRSGIKIGARPTPVQSGQR